MTSELNKKEGCNADYCEGYTDGIAAGWTAHQVQVTIKNQVELQLELTRLRSRCEVYKTALEWLRAGL